MKVKQTDILNMSRQYTQFLLYDQQVLQHCYTYMDKKCQKRS